MLFWILLPFSVFVFSLGTDCFLVLCSKVVLNQFLRKTTYTSDFSWFESAQVKIWEHHFFLHKFSHRIDSCFLCNATCSSQCPHYIFRPELERGIFQLKVCGGEKKKKKSAIFYA